MNPVRFGLIACSSVARRRFLPALAGASLARLERVGSRDPARAEQYAREFGCAKHGSYDAVLADPEVDAVYISTPPTQHDEWIRKAAAAGKHVWCEKPACRDFQAAREAVECCRAAGVRLAEGYVFKFHPQHARVQALIAEQRIGTPRFFHADLIYPYPPAEDIRWKPDLEGGVGRDSAGYPVAAALLQLTGKPVSLFCQRGLDARTGVDDSFCLWMRFSTGVMVQGLAAFGAQYRSRYAVVGTQGRLEVQRAFAVPPDKPAALVLETDAGEEKIQIAPADQFRLMIEEFSAQVRGAAAVRKDFEAELVRQAAVMEAAARSSREGRVIDLSEYPV